MFVSTENNAKTPAYIGDIAYCFGENEFNLNREIEKGVNVDWYSLLMKNGMETFYTTDRSCLDLASYSVGATLKRSAISASDIDAVVFTTCSYRASPNRATLKADNFSLGSHVKEALCPEHYLSGHPTQRLTHTSLYSTLYSADKVGRQD